VRAFIVYWHPEPKSFNHAMFATACEALAKAGASVKTSDLQAMAFDPVSSRANFRTVRDADYLKLQLEELHATEANGFSDLIEAELQKLEWCDLMIWQFPLWWFGLPAALKGWVDRVFAMGRTYGGGHVYETGVFRGKRALLSLTTGGPADAYWPDGFNGDIHGILRPIHRGALRRLRRARPSHRLRSHPVERRRTPPRARALCRPPDRDRRGTADRGRALLTRRGSVNPPGWSTGDGPRASKRRPRQRGAERKSLRGWVAVPTPGARHAAGGSQADDLRRQ
jgi:NAD(P)H dehydrogenase (quinone)